MDQGDLVGAATRDMAIETEVAFISLAYNTGWQGFCQSRIVALWNAGRAREACEAILAWADQTLDADRTVAIIAIQNEPSIKLAQRLGYERQPDGVYHGEPTSVWRRPNPLRN